MQSPELRQLLRLEIVQPAALHAVQQLGQAQPLLSPAIEAAPWALIHWTLPSRLWYITGGDTDKHFRPRCPPMPDETSLSIPEPEGFHEIAKTVLQAVGDLSSGISRLAGETIAAAVKDAYVTGYRDGYRDALRRATHPATPVTVEE